MADQAQLRFDVSRNGGLRKGLSAFRGRHPENATREAKKAWVAKCGRAVGSSGESAAAVVAPAPSAATDAAFDGASVARQAAIMQEKETELIQAASPTLSPLATPEGSHEGSSPGLRVDRDPLSSSSEGGETSSSGSGSS